MKYCVNVIYVWMKKILSFLKILYFFMFQIFVSLKNWNGSHPRPKFLQTSISTYAYIKNDGSWCTLVKPVTRGEWCCLVNNGRTCMIGYTYCLSFFKKIQKYFLIKTILLELSKTIINITFIFQIFNIIILLKICTQDLLN